MKNIRIFTEHFQFLVVRFSIYLNRRVLVMATSLYPMTFFLTVCSALDTSVIQIAIFSAFFHKINACCIFSLETTRKAILMCVHKYIVL